jgi:alkylhydroperoxidase/carboxymuconolactone decarboxylase family protein YurZ
MALPRFLRGLEERDPDLAAAVDKLWATTLEGPLDDKTRILIMLAMDTASGASRGVASLSEQARKLGATEEEIAQTVRIAYVIAGMEALLTGDAAFDE